MLECSNVDNFGEKSGKQKKKNGEWEGKGERGEREREITEESAWIEKRKAPAQSKSRPVVVAMPSAKQALYVFLAFKCILVLWVSAS